MTISKTDRKPRKDSKLKNLSAEKQEKIFAWINGPQSYPGALRACAVEYGITTSETALKEFWKWYPLQLRFAGYSSTAAHMQELLKQSDPSVSAKTLIEFGNKVFISEAIENQDSKGFERGAKLQLKVNDQEMDRDKFEVNTCERFIKWSKDEEAKKIVNSKVSHHEKIERLRKHFFKDVDALEKSGKVKIPK